MSINSMEDEVEPKVSETTPMVGGEPGLDLETGFVEGEQQLSYDDVEPAVADPIDDVKQLDEEDSEEDSDDEEEEGSDMMQNLPKWILVAVIITLLVTFLNTLVILAKMNPTLNTIKDRTDDSKHMIAELGMNVNNFSERVLGLSKYAIPNITPRTFQRDRGTCWDFATVNLLEWHYRDQGLKRGWLSTKKLDDKDCPGCVEYAAFSQQAYGMSMIRQCTRDPKLCDTLGDMVIQNSTEGGEIGWLYYFEGMYDQLLPKSVCPYPHTPGPEHELVCPGMDKALEKNPIKYTLDDMQTAYNVRDSKNLMLNTKHPLGWSSLVHIVDYYLPCADDYWSKQDGCNASQRVRCPENKYYNSEYCAVFQMPCYNMDGEFYMHDDMIMEGGHAMNAVGFNDDYVTRAGSRGGFIIKNSWEDRLYALPRGPRGSHSIKWWMQDISDWDEKRLCPNPFNPTKWLSCVDQAAGPTDARKLDRFADLKSRMDEPVSLKDLQGCLDPGYMWHLVQNFLQPTEFVCQNSDFCNTDPEMRYFLKSSDYNVAADLLRVCFLAYNNNTKVQEEVCTPTHMIPDTIALMWKPVEWQSNYLKDDDDYCGFYFFPYDVVEKQIALYGGFYTTDFTVEFTESSYLSRADTRHFEYELLQNSTHFQKTLDTRFSGPYAWNDHRVPAV